MALHTIVEHDTTHIKPYIDNVKQALSDEVAYAGLKNKIGEIDRTNLTNICTLNADKSITINGTMPSGNSWITIIPILSVKSGNYTLSGCPAGGSTSTYYMYVKDDTSNTQVLQDTGSGATAYLDGSHALKVVIFAQAGQSINKTFYPMLRLASESDATYEPYAYPNSQLLSYKDNGVLGAKNLLPTLVASEVKNGVTITANADGTITLNTDANGATATTNIPIDFVSTTTKLFDVTKIIGKSVIGSILDTEVTGISVKFGYFKSYNTYADKIVQSTTNVQFVYPNDAVYGRTYLIIDSGTVLNNVTVKPMIRLASDTDPTYQPYAKTNQELTKILKSDKFTGTTNANGLVSTNNNRLIFFAYAVPTNAIAHTIVLIDYYTVDGITIFKVLNGTDMTPIASENVTIHYFYLDAREMIV